LRRPHGDTHVSQPSSAVAISNIQGAANHSAFVFAFRFQRSRLRFRRFPPSLPKAGAPSTDRQQKAAERASQGVFSGTTSSSTRATKRITISGLQFRVKTNFLLCTSTFRKWVAIHLPDCCETSLPQVSHHFYTQEKPQSRLVV